MKWSSVVAPSIGCGSRAWWVSTKTGAWNGGSSPTSRSIADPTRPRTGPNMLRSMMNALTGGHLVDLSPVLLGSVEHPGVQLAAEPSLPSSPNGRSSVWLSPAEYPSAEIVMSQITLPIRLVTALSSSRLCLWTAAAALDHRRQRTGEPGLHDRVRGS